MSKIGYTPVTITDGVTFTVEGKKVTITGREGTLSFDIPKYLSLKQEDATVHVERSNDEAQVRAMHGLFRKLLANAVSGVMTPWEKKLEVVGTGYNAKMQGTDIILKVGYSHEVKIPIEDGVRFAVEGNNLITVSGIDRQLVGQVAHKIKSVRKPDPYKGKGLRYQGEYVRIKPGKKAKA